MKQVLARHLQALPKLLKRQSLLPILSGVLIIQAEVRQLRITIHIENQVKVISDEQVQRFLGVPNQLAVNDQLKVSMRLGNRLIRAHENGLRLHSDDSLPAEDIMHVLKHLTEIRPTLSRQRRSDLQFVSINERAARFQFTNLLQHVLGECVQLRLQDLRISGGTSELLKLFLINAEQVTRPNVGSDGLLKRIEKTSGGNDMKDSRVQHRHAVRIIRLALQGGIFDSRVIMEGDKAQIP